MKAEILSVGTELLLGELADTNAHYLAGRLPPLGIDLYNISQVGDNLDRLTEAVRQALHRCEILLITGGLGPTEDDLTREAIAATLGEEMRRDPELEERLRGMFAARGSAFVERNLKQATLVPSARVIPNPRGTAPGWWVERDGRTIIAMPGPPAEMQHMWEEEVEPRLAQLSTGSVIVSRTLKTIGMGESHVDERVSHLLKSVNPTIGVYAKADGVHLRLTAKAASREAARELIGPLERQMRSILGDAIWGADNDTLEGAVGRMLKERGLTLATMESCTGGLLASAITDVDGSASYFRGGYVSYTTEMKIALGVHPGLVQRHGVVSAEVAADMARAVRLELNADYGIGVTGVAGPDELEGKPPGTIHLAVHDGAEAQNLSYVLYHGRTATKRRAVTQALGLLRRALLNKE